MFDRPDFRSSPTPPPLVRSLRPPVLWAALALLAVAAPTSGQVVRGQVFDEGGTHPVRGALVTLLDAQGERVRGVLTSSDGGFVIPAPRAGRYRLRAEMIGRRSLETQAFEVDGGTHVVSLSLPIEPIELEGIDASAESRCSVAADVGLATLQVWDEVEKALRAEAITRRSGHYQFGISRFQRLRDPQTRLVMNENVSEGTAVSARPFRTLPPEEIAEEGYARRIGSNALIYGPDTEVLLSPTFRETHCFGLREDRRRGRIGLTFKPVKGRRVTDIEGVLWLDASTAELLTMDFRYRNLPRGLAWGTYDGTLEFQRLESGAWIIGRWRLRTPTSEEGAEVLLVEPVRATFVEEDDEVLEDGLRR